jgi:hypothetical protein
MPGRLGMSGRGGLGGGRGSRLGIRAPIEGEGGSVGREFGSVGL